MYQDEKTTVSERVERLKELIEDLKVAMLTTVHSDGSLRSRPMMTQDLDSDGTLWFFTGRDGQKSDDIIHHGEVNLSFSNPGDNKFVSISGNAQLVFDKEKAKELWTPFAKAWFPDGVDDPNLALIKVDVKGAEYWDVKSGFMVQLIGFVKATFTGKPMDEKSAKLFSQAEKISGSDIKSAMH